MKKTATFIVLISLGLVLPAQKRNLIPNGDFEAAPGGESGGSVVRTARNQSVISIAGLERGIYFLRISKDGQFVVSKFLN